MIIHLIQPYPYLEYHYRTRINGIKIIYSIDMFLFALSLLRLYVFVKTLKKWSNYTNSRGGNILKRYWSFGKKIKEDMYLLAFLYKTCIRTIPFISSFVIFLVSIFLFSYIFKIFENYQNSEMGYVFGRFLNCIWYLMQTMTTVGYGEYTPDTFIGRVIGGIICFCGLVCQSLFTICLLVNISFTEENEVKSYVEINVYYTKEESNNNYNIYFNLYLKRKIKKIVSNLKQGDNIENYINAEGEHKISLLKEIKRTNNFNTFKEQKLLSVLASTQIPITLAEFNSFVSKHWEPEMETCIEWYRDRIDISKIFFDSMYHKVSDYRNQVIDLMYKNYHMDRRCD